MKLKSEDWTSGETIWLLDVIAPTKQLATTMLKNFRQVAKKDQIRMHPLVARMVDQELLTNMGAKADNGVSTAEE